MQYEVEIGGKVRQVVVTRTGGAFAVSVDGRTRQVDAVRVDANTLSLLVDSLLPAEHGAAFAVVVWALASPQHGAAVVSCFTTAPQQGASPA